MLQKILDFLKLRLIETSGLIVLTFSIFYLYSIVTYSPENATLITPGKTDDVFLINYSFYMADFLLQAFGLPCFLIFINLFIWSWLIVIKKVVSNFSIKLLFIVFYLCLSIFGLKVLSHFQNLMNHLLLRLNILQVNGQQNIVHLKN